MTRIRCAAVVLVLTFGVSGCASAVSGHGALSPHPTGPSTPGFPSGPPSDSTSGSTSPPVRSTTGSAGGSAAPLTAAQVDARAEKPPPGATAWSSGWARTRHPSVTSFVQHVYEKKDVANEVTRLHGEGLQDVTHQTWYARSAHQADIVLLRFASEQGATDRFAGVTAAKAAAGVKSFVVSTDPYAIGYYSPKPDSLGNVGAIVYGRVANVAVEEFYFSPRTLSEPDAVTWMRLQLRRLAG